jgi:hypothetical protein
VSDDWGRAGDGSRRRAALPGVVYVPAHPVMSAGRPDIELEVRRLDDGSRALPAFTTRSKLVAALGPAQPWAALPLSEARGLAGDGGVPVVVIDPPVDAGAWRWTARDVESFAGRL